MKRRKLTLPFLFGTMLTSIVLLAASCEGSEMPDSPADGKEVPLRISSLALTGEATVSRAATSVDIATGKNVGFFVKAESGKYAAQNNLKGVYSNTATLKAWVPSPDSIWLNNQDATVMVYYPYAAGQTSSTLTLTPKLYPATGDDGDLSYARFTANNRYLVTDPKKIDLTLNPVYARLVVTVIKDADYPTEVKIGKITVSGGNICSSANLDMTTGGYSRSTGAVTTTFTEKTVGLAGSASPASIDLLLIPNDLSSDDVSLTLEPDGKKTTAVIARAKFGNKLEAGKQYTVTVKLKPGTLTPGVSDVTIEDWTAGSSISSDTEFD